VLCDTGEGSGGADMSVIPGQLVGTKDRTTVSLLIVA
jgi:hypothetical protein